MRANPGNNVSRSVGRPGQTAGPPDAGSADQRPSRGRKKKADRSSLSRRWSWTTNLLCCENAHGVRIIRYEPYAQATPDQVHKMDRATASENGNTGRHWATFISGFAETRNAETLFEETLIPACSRALLKIQGQPREPADLDGWPLLYDLHWTTYWSHWFAHHGAGEADLSQASGVPTLQHDGSGRGGGHGRRPWPLTDDRPRAQAGNPGLPVRRPRDGAGAVLAGHGTGIER